MCLARLSLAVFLLLGAAAFSPSAAADVVVEWNAVLRDTIRAEATPPPWASRAMAMMSTAVYDAVNATDPRHAAYRPTAPLPGASAEAAAAQAAHDVLASLFPAHVTTYDARLAADLAAVPDGAARAAGVALGTAVALSAVAARAADGSATVATYAVQAGPGEWRPTPSAFAPPLVPQWGGVTPFGIPAASMFLPPPPPALDSPDYAAAVAEVKAFGAATGSLRSDDQTQIAFFWADGAGTETPPGHWNRIAGELAVARALPLSDRARLFAMLDVALADAAIVAWDAKYLYDVWRPITAIRQADEVAVTAALADPIWSPLLPTPPFPEYVSGHSTFSAAAATVLASFFGTDDVPFTVTSDALGPLVSRSFPGFAAAAAEAGMSRIYGGIHFPSGNAAGAAVGRSVGGFVADALFAPVPEPGGLALAVAGVVGGIAASLARSARGRLTPRAFADRGAGGGSAGRSGGPRRGRIRGAAASRRRGRAAAARSARARTPPPPAWPARSRTGPPRRGSRGRRARPRAAPCRHPRGECQETTRPRVPGGRTGGPRPRGCS